MTATPAKIRYQYRNTVTGELISKKEAMKLDKSAYTREKISKPGRTRTVYRDATTGHLLSARIGKSRVKNHPGSVIVEKLPIGAHASKTTPASFVGAHTTASTIPGVYSVPTVSGALPMGDPRYPDPNRFYRADATPESEALRLGQDPVINRFPDNALPGAPNPAIVFGDPNSPLTRSAYLAQSVFGAPNRPQSIAEATTFLQALWGVAAGITIDAGSNATYGTVRVRTNVGLVLVYSYSVVEG